ncbi:Motility associated factor glycosyltransferase family protein [Sulfidibacter corallicola]|uniref:Motility associated factor glycosyltransferase family protein n=1 Tax=Sulfidibacter corallicola TaxID=2818388 RepID=A0A8A4TVE6_SULCO|nr:6-hydroxymethylpterin diphosphokinase MptE-like protein [Sulfidibacter corallicola]QTD53919.1 motility associated factor glycosyltransferase family protein [Sulfidibacter corallicola]
MTTDIASINRAFLASYDPQLLAEIDAAPSAHFTRADTPSGHPTLQRGKQFLHDPRDPAAEAKRLLDLQPRELHLHFGFGLGYFLEADQPGQGGTTLVFEPDPGVLRCAFETRRLDTLLPSRGTLLFSDIHRFDSAMGRYLQPGVTVSAFAAPQHQAFFPQHFQAFAAAYNKAHEKRRFHKGLFDEAVAGTWRSTVQSLPFSSRATDAERLLNTLKGMPAVVISAGPSLEKHLDTLRLHQDRVVIFAIARTAHLLERNGIRPHFLVHIEAQDFIDFIDDCTNLDETDFLLAEQTEKGYFQFPHRQTFVFQSRFNPVTRWLNLRLPALRKQIAATSGSVSSIGFFMAALAGCSPIVLLGQDLALKGEHIYADGHHNAAYRFSGNKVRYAPGFFGGRVQTLDHYLLTAYWFQDAVPQLQKQFPDLELYNATGTGLALPYFQPIRFREACHRFFTRPLDVAERVRAVAERDAGPELSESIRTEIGQLLAVLSNLEALKGRFQSLRTDFNKRLRRIKKPKDVAALQRKLPKLDQLNQALQEAHANHQGLEFFFQSELDYLKQIHKAMQTRGAQNHDFGSWQRQLQADLDEFQKFYDMLKAKIEKLRTEVFADAPV